MATREKMGWKNIKLKIIKKQKFEIIKIKRKKTLKNGKNKNRQFRKLSKTIARENDSKS